MTPLQADWYITPDATNDEAYSILSQDPVWNSFALADLEPPLRDFSQFAVASYERNDERAICLILRHPIIGEVLSPFGNVEGVVAILKQISLPKHPLIQAQEQHVPTLQLYYRPETTWKRMLRMAITSNSWWSLTFEPRQPVKRLAVADLPALKRFYAQHPESGFSADLFAQGLYFGAYIGERIVAAGGTHALVPNHGIAVLGNILTASDIRRQGYATAITAALIETLFEEQFSLLILNVFEDNTAAIRVYQRLGFQIYHRLLTGKAIVAS